MLHRRILLRTGNDCPHSTWWRLLQLFPLYDVRTATLPYDYAAVRFSAGYRRQIWFLLLPYCTVSSCEL